MTVQMVSQFKTPQEQADYFMQFRADSIVRDSELIRETLLGNVRKKERNRRGGREMTSVGKIPMTDSNLLIF